MGPEMVLLTAEMIQTDRNVPTLVLKLLPAGANICGAVERQQALALLIRYARRIAATV